MVKMDAGRVYGGHEKNKENNDQDNKSMEIETSEKETSEGDLKQKLDFARESMVVEKDETKGVWCDSCKQFIASGNVIYHCENIDSLLHPNGYDVCLECSKKQLKKSIDLQSYDLSGLAQFLKSAQCKNVVVLVGAGISRAAGIPDFRFDFNCLSSDGIYGNLQADKYSLTNNQRRRVTKDAQYIFNIELFRHNPKVN
ncbi:silent information regulator protein Sir2 [Reticulomyxa filosa]|uniref:Silent information regulator protein Sir2 n=1 Tax=Reticulomyxa filosa TaxID=46433 RepID=X6NM62_RETFI|nr:silent information regulator protein Sir2 [Reticulomyxa filosa]|eukprot:ETO27101.1 silent information regulator protein Sir2 [Reticulomyxa filosa]